MAKPSKMCESCKYFQKFCNIFILTPAYFSMAVIWQVIEYYKHTIMLL